MAAALGKVRTERGARRCQEIVEAAFEVFLERGYAGASMDAVVERAGGSKETLYAHFGNKAGLLRAIIEQGVGELIDRLSQPSSETSVEACLIESGIGYLDLVLSPRTLALYRLVLAESGRMPEAGDLFYRLGPEALAHGMANRLRGWMAEGRIGPIDPEKSATLFYAMLRGELHLRALFNPTRAPVEREIREHVHFVVERFLKLCGMPQAKL